MLLFILIFLVGVLFLDFGLTSKKPVAESHSTYNYSDITKTKN